MRVGNKLSVVTKEVCKILCSQGMNISSEYMLKEAPFRLRPSTQSEETAGVCLLVSVSPADPPYPLSGVSAPSPTSHTRTDSGWAWLCPPESEVEVSTDSPSCTGHNGPLPIL